MRYTPGRLSGPGGDPTRGGRRCCPPPSCTSTVRPDDASGFDRTGDRHSLSELGPLYALASEWRDDAATLRCRGAPRQADALESAADELDDRLRAWRLEALTPAQAAEESGYTADHIRRLIRGERVPNAGDDTAPKIRRRDLPRKPGHVASNGSGPASSRTRVARTVIDSDGRQ